MWGWIREPKQGHPGWRDWRPGVAFPEQHPQLHRRIGDGPTLPFPETAAIALRARLCLGSDRVTLSTVREI